MNNKKLRLLALLLAVIMVFSVIPFSAFATEGTSNTFTVGSSNTAGSSNVQASDAGANGATDDTTSTAADLTINSVIELQAFATEVNKGNDYEGKTVVLGKDIVLSGEWTPIGNGTRDGKSYTGNAFKGTFDGKGYTITSLTNKSTNADAAVGLFGVVDGGTVKNLTLANVSIDTASENAGAVIGLMVGGATAENISVSGSVKGADGVGGIAGRMTVDATVNNCTNYAAVTATTTGAAGGIVGKAYYTEADKEMTVSNSTNYGSINGSYVAGGIVGFSTANVIDCLNAGAVTAEASVGGIVGWQQMYGEISGNENTVSITASAVTTAGGIVGWIAYQYKTDGTAAEYGRCEIVTVDNNTNSGAITAASTALGSGGIVGGIYNAAVVTNNVSTAASITGYAFAAGIVGNIQVQDANGFLDKKVTVTGNKSTTALSAIKANNVNAIVYDNTTDRNEIANNSCVSGTITPAYTAADKIWGESTNTASESFVVKLYSGTTLLATATLNNKGGIINGSLNVTWNIPLNTNDNGGDSYWTIEWEKKVTVDLQPTHVVACVDGQDVATNNVVLNAPDNLNKIVAATVNADGEFTKYYTSLQGAVDAAKAGDTITVLVDVNGETVTVDKSVTIIGSATLTDVSITGSTGIELTVSGLTFKGNSWINSNGAAKLTVSGVTANVTPSNGSATNSRSAFIALGRSEQATLALTVENSTFVVSGGGDSILGWAAITEATITGNTFGAEDAYIEKADAVKFMSIADGAVFTITGNTVYSNFNGFVFGQNTTRDNAYTVIVDDNDFYGTADYVWIEVSGATETHAAINATSKNTVNGEAFTADDIKAISSITTWTSYAGVDVVLDENGKVVGGTLKFYGEDAIAPDFKVENGIVVARDYVAQVGNDKYETLQSAINAAADGDTVTLLADCSENVTITQKDGINLTIDGGNFTYSGTIYIDGTSIGEAEMADESLVIKNFEFVTTEADHTFISANITNHYPHNVTIQKCSFTGKGDNTTKAIDLKSSYDCKIVECTGTGLHSFIQNRGGHRLTIENVTVTESKSGLALGTVQNVTVKNVNIDASDVGYGIRLDAAYATTATIEDSTISAFIPVVVRGNNNTTLTEGFSLVFDGENDFNATNTDGFWCVIGDTEYDENGNLPTASEKVNVTINDPGLDIAGVSGLTADGITTEAELIEAINNGITNIVVSASITLNSNVTVGAKTTITVEDGCTLRVFGALTNNGTINGKVAVSVMVYVVSTEKPYEGVTYDITATKNGSYNENGTAAGVVYEISLDGGKTWIADTTNGKAQAVLVKTDGTTVVYSSFQSAFTTAKTGEIVHMLTDAHVQSTNTKKNIGPLRSYYGLILEGNGHTIYTDLEASGASNEYATIKFTSYLAGTGPEVNPVLKNVTIDSQKNAKADLDYVSGDVTFTVTMYNVNLLGNCQYASFPLTSPSMIVNKSNVEIYDSTIPSWDASSAKAIDIYSGEYSLTLNSKCTVYGGTFTKDVTNYLAECVTLTKIDGKYVVSGPYEAKIGDTYYDTFAEAIAAAKTGDTITLLLDITLTEDVTIPDGVTLDGNGKTINGTIKAGGDLTFVGATTVSAFGSGSNNTITIGVGASLTVTSNRMTVSYGNVFNITGSVENANYADKSGITPSLVLTEGISFNGSGNGVEFNVTNAYVKLGDTTSKNSGATGTFNVNFNNSIVDFTNTLKTYEPTASGLDPVIKITATNSVVSFASHLELWNAKTELTLDNSNLTVGGSFANAGTVNVKNGAKLTVKAPIMSSHGGNTGSINIDGATFELADSNQDWENAGTIKVTATGKLITNDFKCVGEGKIVVDAKDLANKSNVTVVDGNGVYDFTGVVTVENGAGVTVSYENGDVTITKFVVAQIGDNYYATLTEALKALKDGDTLVLLDDVTITEKWDCRYNGAKITAANVTIDGNEHTITLTGEVDDKNWNTVFRFDGDNATVKNLTIDASAATSIQRGISAKYSITVDGCTIIGNGTSAKRAIIFGEGAGTAIADVTATVTNSTFSGWTYGVSDNQSGKDAKSVTVTGNTFTNLSVLISASENIVFNNNTVTGGYANISSYSVPNKLTVEALGNTLDANYSEDNTIKAATINAQDGFMLPVAQVGGKYYLSLQAAVDAAKNDGTVTLIADITLEKTVHIYNGYNVTLDLNGKTIDFDQDAWVYGAANSGTALLTVDFGGKLTIDDTSATETGTIDGSANVDDVYSAVMMTAKGDNADNGTATLVVNGGTLLGGYAAIAGNKDRDNTEIVINGGTIKAGISDSYSTAGIEHPMNGKLTITGGTIVGMDGISFRSGTLVITGGTIIGTAPTTAFEDDGYWDNDFGTCTGHALQIVSRANSNPANETPTVTITGGTFISVNRTAVGSYAGYKGETPDTQIVGFISGGTFSSDVDALCKSGFTTADNGNGTFGIKKKVSGSSNGHVSISGTPDTESYRERLYYEINGINAQKSLVINIYSNGVLIATTKLLETLYPFNGTATVNVVVKGKPSGSWDTTWYVAPSVAYIPDEIKVFVDDKLEYSKNMVMAATEVAEYKALSGVYKAATVENNGTVEYYVTVAEAFAALKSGDTLTILEAGTYSLNGISGKNITVTGAVDGVEFANIGAFNMGGASVTFNNVTFTYASNSTYKGLQHAGTLTYNNCTFNGQVFLYGESETFNNCTFNQTSADAYNVWTYGAKVVEFNECTFNCAGKAVLVYNEGACATDLTVEKTTFKASSTVEGKAAIEIDTSKMPGQTSITVDGDTTATGFDAGSVSGSTLWNNKKGSDGENNDITVVVDGETVLRPTKRNLGSAVLYDDKNVVGDSRFYMEITDPYATESIVVKLYTADGKLLATTTLRNNEYLQSATLGVKIGITATSSSWETVWESAQILSTDVPAKVELWIDGVMKDTANVYMGSPDFPANFVDWADVEGVVTPNVSITNANGTTYYTTLAEAFKAAKDGDTVTLFADAKITESLVLNANGTITIEGNGHTIKPASNYADKQNGALMLGTTASYDAEAANRIYTIKNVVFDGFTEWSVIRAQGVTLTLDGCTIQNCKQTNGQSLVRLDYTEATIENCTINGNTALMAITYNFNGDDSNTKLLVSNCVLEGNTFNKTAAVYYVTGSGCTIENSEFVENTVNCSNNGAVIYLGFQENCKVTGNLFKDNKVTDSSTSTRVAGAIFFGYEAEVSGNAFINNTASNANRDVLGQVCVSTYHDCEIDLNGNYWGGEAPVYGKDYTLQHQTGEGDFVLDNYYENYTTDENGNVVLNGEVTITYAAKVGKLSYYTIADAIKAAQAGDTVTILAGEYTENVSVNKAITVIGETDAEGNNLVTINGGIDITADDAVVKNLTASDPATSGYNCTLYINAGNVLVEGCVITDYNATRFCYAKGLVTFKNCVITGDVYGIHFDGSTGGEIVIDGCTITGWTSFSSAIETVSMTNTTFEVGNYNYVRFYQKNVVIDHCTFNENMQVDLAISGAEATVTNTTINNGNVEDLFEGEDMVNSTISVDGVKLVRVAYVTVNDTTTYYKTLKEALAATVSGAKVTLVGDIHDEGVIRVPAGVTIEGAGHEISGNTALYVDANGSVVINEVSFHTIHNAEGKLSAIYAIGLAGSVTITNCYFYDIDWDAIQITPVDGAEIVITDNVFQATKDNQQRYVHIQSAGSVSFSACITENKMQQAANPNLAPLDVYYFEDADKVFVRGNDISNTIINNVCILNGAGENKAEMILPLSGSVTYSVVVKGQYNAKFYNNLAAAIANAEAGETVLLLADANITELIAIYSAITLDLNGKTVTSTAKKAFEVYSNTGMLTIKDGTIIAVERCVDTRYDAQLTLNHVTLETTEVYGQPLTIGGNYNGTVVNVIDSTIKTTHYPIIVFVESIINVENSTLNGHCGIYFKEGADNSVATIDADSVINASASDDGYDFAAIVFEKVEGVEVTVYGTVNAGEYAVLLNYDAGNSVALNGNVTAETLIGYYTSASTVTTTSATIAGALEAEGYFVIQSDGVYSVYGTYEADSVAYLQVQVAAGPAKYEYYYFRSLEEAIKFANENCKGNTAIFITKDATVYETIEITNPSIQTIKGTGTVTITSYADVAFKVTNNGGMTIQSLTLIANGAVAIEWNALDPNDPAKVNEKGGLHSCTIITEGTAIKIAANGDSSIALKNTNVTAGKLVESNVTGTATVRLFNDKIVCEDSGIAAIEVLGGKFIISDTIKGDGSRSSTINVKGQNVMYVAYAALAYNDIDFAKQTGIFDTVKEYISVTLDEGYKMYTRGVEVNSSTSLKYDSADFGATSSSIRFSYSFKLPEGANLTSIMWKYGASIDNLVAAINGESHIKNEADGSVMSSAVLKLSARNYAYVLYIQAYVTYELNGVEYEFVDDVRSDSIWDYAVDFVTMTADDFYAFLGSDYTDEQKFNYWKMFHNTMATIASMYTKDEDGNVVLNSEYYELVDGKVVLKAGYEWATNNGVYTEIVKG